MFLQDGGDVKNDENSSEGVQLDPKNMKVAELRAELAARNLSTKGELFFIKYFNGYQNSNELNENELFKIKQFLTDFCGILFSFNRFKKRTC